MKAAELLLISMACLFVMGGCVVDDSAGGRGVSQGPTASTPNSGAPGRRESAAKTMRPAAKSGDALNADTAPMD